MNTQVAPVRTAIHQQHCRAEPCGEIRAFARCLLREPNCPHASSLDSQWLCYHPLRHRIVEQTRHYGHAGYQNPINIEVGSIDD